MKHQKSMTSVYSALYIRKSYATTVYKCDDEKNDPFFV